jgi:hypothetical protein
MIELHSFECGFFLLELIECIVLYAITPNDKYQQQ